MMVSQNFNRRHSPNRRKTRVEVTVEADGQRLEGVIYDVSFEGMKLTLSQPVAPGTPITIEVLKHRIPAIVHWCENGQVGVHLLERLEGQTLIALENAHDEWAEFR